MSNSRKPKEIQKEIQKASRTFDFSRDEKKSVEKALIGQPSNIKQMVYNYSEDIIPRLKYPIESLKNLIETNGYVSLCINKRAESAVGKGFNEIEKQDENLFATDPWIIENIDILELLKTEKSAIGFGEFYWDVPIFRGEPQTVYHVPTSTMLRGAKAKEGLYCQYYGIKGKEKWLPALDLEELRKGTLKTGHYIYHWKNGEQAYGVPEWIAGQMEIMTSKEQRRTILSHYLNNCDPDRITVHYGQGGVTPEMANDYKTKREKYTQGSENAGKSDNIFRSETYAELGKAVEVIEIKKEIITAVGLQMGYQNKQDICAFMSTPSFLVNLKSLTGGFGNVNEVETQLHFYINDTIMPAQRQRYYMPFSKLFPGKAVQFNTITMPKLTQMQNQDVTVETEKAEKIVKAFINESYNVNEQLRIIEKQ